jgi:peptidoglycan/xylan/chitin deacetylase (PgdA/CDA1 family)
MKFRKTYLILGMLAGRAASGRAQTPMPIANPGFEEGVSGWTILEENESMSTASPDAAYAGKLGLRVEDNSDTLSSKALSSSIDVIPGKTYRLTFWARTFTPGRMGVFFRFNDGSQKIINEGKLDYLSIDQGNGEWREYTKAVRAPEGAATLMVWIHSYSKMTGSTDFDEFVLVESDEQPDTPASVPSAAAAPKREGPAKIIIKADDLRVHKGKIHPQWVQFIDYIKESGIKASIGIICDSLEGDNPEYVQSIKDLQASGQFEFWQHGYDHKEWQEGEKKVFEFQGATYDHQKKNFARANELAKEKLGFAFRTFGAPFNATDAETLKVLEEDGDIRVWLYGKPFGDKDSSAKKIVLDRLWDVNIENPLFVPNSQKFIEGYKKHPDRDYFVIQGHPSRWSEPGRFEEFKKIVEFLKGEGAIFITPHEYGEQLAGEAKDKATVQAH